ncbi:lipopolysaccharide biosynthesis protein [Mucilaginibacter celer]|uniref:Polysaccharide biosynthesis protein C-terminal domain-containing protein n=1 Tax=Mucilaginibacter celer TaxID=2305508 RepID=A0A494VVZ6_9SPHI|nr:oligosaccharide flippase family protein [Mucilaginibacter celer]AYL95162.1 hypothetical protein HYN43_007575 [Mucilaginibacter celer]
MFKKLLYSNTSWSLISNGLTAILGFVNLALIARIFTKDQAGMWFMLLTVYTLLEMLRSGWVQTPFIRFYVSAQHEDERRKLTGASWQLLLAFTLVISLFLLPALLFKSFDQPAFKLAKHYTVLWLLCALPFQLLQWQLQARSQFKKLAAIKIIFALLFSAFLLLQFKLKLDLEITVMFYGGIQLFIGMAGILVKWVRLGRWDADLSAERKKLSGFGKYSMLTMITSSLLRSSDQFIIAAWLGPSALALYAIPQKLVEAIEIPVRSFASVAMPAATALYHKHDSNSLRMLFYRQAGFLSFIILPLVAVLLLFPVPVVNLLGGGKYLQSAMLLRIFCCYALLIPLDRYCGLLLDAANRPGLNSLKVILMLIVNVVLDIAALSMGMGLYGVAAGSTITFLLGVIIGWGQLKDILCAFKPILFWREGITRSFNSFKNTPIPLK